ncbi:MULTISPECIES: DNA polymerase IV [Leuconostoc]|uniref:DNA polymerase IV n=2 Tax=Leuconostoc kimchii TaxID=136609 RepID=D5T586_LEUKI|nr:MULTISPECIES: DNA polymerase IV [Leuconostoc]ADG41216.1 DNA-damage-inducible protein P [Leuconostoc kimchii IMSNU 11154]AEJ30808.1 DNA-damage-inducible protein P [Leuconostoc sp. C2]QBR47914.1 DNA polymerase IV [Leuconostoc kimchii]
MTDFLIANDARKILHVDLDAFYAQVEMRDNPELRTKALIISRDPEETGGHGVVATANYIARNLGIHSAMRAAEAKRLAPNGVFLTPNFSKYKIVSQQIHEIFHNFTDKVEPVAFDEAYLDITDLNQPSAQIAAEIRHEILRATRLTSSIGVSHNKLLAKLGSEFNKPNGVTVITPENMLLFLDELSIGEFRGVGKKTREKFEALDIENGAQLRVMSYEKLRGLFGKMGENLYWQARGVHFGEVKWQRQQQSIGKEETFDQMLHREFDIQEEFKKLAVSMIKTMRTRHLVGRTLNIKIRDANFVTTTRATTHEKPWPLSEEAFVQNAQVIFDELIEAPFSIRLLGMSMSNLQSSAFEEMTLF